MKTLAIDLETYSELDIKKVGLYKYAANCEILLFAYAFDDEPIKIVDLADGEKLPDDLIQALFNPEILKTAYNAPFEMQVLKNYFGREMDAAQWSCTMVLGLTLGLPAGLERIGKAMKLSESKMKNAIGKKLISYFSKPCTPTRANHYRTRNMPFHNWTKWYGFKEYCKQDVESERALREIFTPYMPSDTEKKLWQLDQKINDNGVLIDMELVDGAINIDEQIKSLSQSQAENLTGGLNVNSNVQMLDWIEEQEGWRPDSLDKESREELQAENLTPQVKELLRLKDLIGKTSVKKYKAMKNMVSEDNRARGMFQFYGANRSGRFTGKGIQLQNLPQNHIEDLDTARQFVKNSDLEALQIFYENPSVILSQLIRTAFVAEEGKRFIVADFSAIEARIIAWLADEKWRMKVFEDGKDIYCASASAMFHVPVEKHGRNKELRAKGKIAELACGYGGGANALKAFGADKMGLSDSEMESIIKKWRESSPNICNLWREIEGKAKIAVQEKKEVFYKKGISFIVEGDFLFVKLPSGRRIAYAYPKIIFEEEFKRESLVYYGTLQATGGWGRNFTWGGKLVENIVQATARDCLAVAMLRLDEAGYKIVMHVHDEIISEMPKGQGSLAEVIGLMSKPLEWAEGLVLTADGYETKYYRKD